MNHTCIFYPRGSHSMNHTHIFPICDPYGMMYHTCMSPTHDSRTGRTRFSNLRSINQTHLSCTLYSCGSPCTLERTFFSDLRFIRNGSLADDNHSTFWMSVNVLTFVTRSNTSIKVTETAAEPRPSSEPKLQSIQMRSKDYWIPTLCVTFRRTEDDVASKTNVCAHTHTKKKEYDLRRPDMIHGLCYFAYQSGLADGLFDTADLAA